ncbi:Met-10+ protein [archaeon GW2011_AR15]|nr:Met-10+ protein [archaeon GW2011_AR15]MBS3103913.1 class I SAM-dependent methyltransferase family protein [Candidatus Woesearchaeota archaeon]
MLAVKVELKDAEKVKREMIAKGIYDKNYKPKKTKTHIFFPVQEKPMPPALKKAVVKTKLKKTEPEDYKKMLLASIPKGVSLPASYDIVGDIIILEIKEDQEKYEKEIAGVLLKAHRNVKTILKKAGIHGGEFRTQKLKCLAGENKKETTYTENGARMKLDVEKTYFSSRLATERKRIAAQVKKKEKILVMFSGIGVYPLVISKNTPARKIVGIEKNPVAHKYAEQNLKLNKAVNIALYKGDVRKIVPKLKEKFDRIIMPLPKEAAGFLDVAEKAWKKGTIVHLYGFSHQDNLDETEKEVRKFCKANKIKAGIIRTITCGQYSPRKYRVCVDFKIK